MVFIGKGDRKPPKQVDMGNSGTMVLNELVRGYPFLPYKNIVYMASASSISDIYRSIIPLLTQYEEKLKSEIMRLQLEITSLAGGVASLRESRKSSQSKKKQIMKQIMEKQNDIQERTAELRKKGRS